MNKIINVVICYANEDEVVEYAKQLSGQSVKQLVKLVVVVNKSDKGEEYLSGQLSKWNIEYKIFSPGKNLGYLNGLLFGISQDDEDSDWYIFSNTDIHLPDTEMLSKFMNDEIIKQKDIWLVGPSIYTPSRGGQSNPYMVRRPSKRSYLIKNIGMSFPHLYDTLFRIKRGLKKAEDNNLPRESGNVYAVHGSFFFIRNYLIRELLSRKEWELLYDEEQYLAEIVRMNGKNVYYEPILTVNHMEGTSTGKVNVNARYSKMKTANKRILREFYRGTEK